MVENKVFMLQDIQAIFKVKYPDLIQPFSKTVKNYKNITKAFHQRNMVN